MKKSTANPNTSIFEPGLVFLNSKDPNKFLAKLKRKENLKIVFFGTPEFVLPVFEALDQTFDVVAVVTTESAAHLWDNKSVLVLTPEKLDSEFVNQLAQLEADLFVMAAYGKILPKDILEIPKFGCLNIHPSLLPKYRGPSPIQAAILNQDQESGVTIIKMDKEMDHGPIIYQERISLTNQDTFETLSKKLFLLGTDALVKIIPDFIDEKLKLKPQDHKSATFCKLIKKSDGYFDIDNPPSKELLDKMIRAYYPWPTVWTKWNNKIVKFLPTFVCHPDPGITKEEGYNFCIQLESKKVTTLKDFLNGYPNFPLKEF